MKHAENAPSREAVCVKQSERPTFFIDLRIQNDGADSLCNREVEQLMKTKSKCEQILRDFTKRTINPVARQLLYRSDDPKKASCPRF